DFLSIKRIYSRPCIAPCLDIHLIFLSLFYFFYCSRDHRYLHFFPTRRSSDLPFSPSATGRMSLERRRHASSHRSTTVAGSCSTRSEEHTSELQSRGHLVCRLLLEKKKQNTPRWADRQVLGASYKTVTFDQTRY